MRKAQIHLCLNQLKGDLCLVGRFPEDFWVFPRQEEDLLRGTGTSGSNKAESNATL